LSVAVKPEEQSSSNAIAKVCGVLRALVSREPLRLSEIADVAGLNRVTTLRILDALVKEGFVGRKGSPARYIFGPEIAAMTAISARTTDIVAIAHPSLIRLAAETEDTALLSVRINAEAVCLDQQVGSFPIRANRLDIGSRRPLGVGAGSMALLAWMPELEIDAIFEAYSNGLSAYPRLSAAVLRQHIEQARAKGYVRMINVVIDKMGAIGAPIFDSAQTVIGALSVAALTERICDREAEIAAAVLRETSRIGRALAERAPSEKSKRRSEASIGH
jgi:DNA-binding IclR family transcriptional regulator